MQILPEKFSIVVMEELPQFDFAVLKSLTALVVSIVSIGLLYSACFQPLL